MGSFVFGSTRRSWPLQGVQTFGRGSGCYPLATEAYVSSYHAEIRWRAGVWQLKDLGSRNGTFVNAQPVRVGEWTTLQRGDRIALGNLEGETWELADDLPPVPLLVPSSGAPPIALDGSLVGFPLELPQVTLWRGEDGGWLLETEDGAIRTLKPNDSFELNAVQWRLVAWESSSTTDILTRPTQTPQMQLSIRHSLDEEHVEVSAIVGGSLHSLGERQHHYLLLLLARQRLEDRSNGVPEGSCGWVYQDDFTRQLGVDRTQLNLQVFRIRQQFAAVGGTDPATIIARRVQTRQLRLGIQDIQVELV